MLFAVPAATLGISARLRLFYQLRETMLAQADEAVGVERPSQA